MGVQISDFISEEELDEDSFLFQIEDFERHELVNHILSIY